MECLDPGTPENGFRNVESFLLDGVVKYQCNPGYTMVGPEERTCVLSNFEIGPPLMWDRTLPSCVGE